MNETEVRNKWDTPATVCGWFVLLAFTALSSYMNAEYAVLTESRVWFHAGIPAAVLVLGVVVEFTYLSSAPTAAKRIVLAGIGACFFIVIVASYLAVRTMTIEWNAAAPAWVNNSLAAVPDVVMVMAATLILALRMKSHRAATTTAKPRTPSAAKQIMGNYTQRWVERSEGKKQQVITPEEAPQSFTEPSPNTITEGIESSADDDIDRRETAVETSADQPKTAAKPSTKVTSKPAAKVSAPSVKPELMPFMEAAQHMVDTGVVARKTAAELAEVIAAIEKKMSPNAIKSTLGISPGTTAKVKDAWQRWNSDDQEDADDQEDVVDHHQLVGAVA